MTTKLVDLTVRVDDHLRHLADLRLRDGGLDLNAAINALLVRIVQDNNLPFEMHVKRPSEALNEHRAEIRAIVAANKGLNPRVFGSVLRGEDTVGSDLDLLIDPDKGLTLIELARMTIAIRDLLGVRVDLVTPQGLPDAWRDRVLTEAVPV